MQHCFGTNYFVTCSKMNQFVQSKLDKSVPKKQAIDFSTQVNDKKYCTAVKSRNTVDPKGCITNISTLLFWYIPLLTGYSEQ